MEKPRPGGKAREIPEISAKIGTRSGKLYPKAPKPAKQAKRPPKGPLQPAKPGEKPLRSTNIEENQGNHPADNPTGHMSVTQPPRCPSPRRRSGGLWTPVTNQATSPSFPDAQTSPAAHRPPTTSPAATRPPAPPPAPGTPPASRLQPCRVCHVLMGVDACVVPHGVHMLVVGCWACCVVVWLLDVCVGGRVAGWSGLPMCSRAIQVFPSDHLCDYEARFC